MLLKWIVCQVTPAMAPRFSTAQAQWQEIRETAGLVGQFGGWDRLDQESACIVSVWETPAAYDEFMEQGHDLVTSTNQQEATYEAISVELFDGPRDLPGRHRDLTTAAAHGGFVRVADCLVRDRAVEHFVRMQDEVWIPGMRAAPGMLGGSFVRSRSDPTHFLVLTLWDSPQAHHSYVHDALPALRIRANVPADVRSSSRRLVELEQSWLVQPSADLVSFVSGLAVEAAATALFEAQVTKLRALFPFEVDLQHVGSTAVTGSLTKGDLDIQVRVPGDRFEWAEEILAVHYERNLQSERAEGFAAFKDDGASPPLGLQLTTIDGSWDTFWRFRDLLLARPELLDAYNALKRRFEGRRMSQYRVAKRAFIEGLGL